MLKLIHLFIFFPCHTFQSFGSRDRSEGAALLSSVNPCYSHLQKSKKQEEIWRGNPSQINGGGKQRNYWEIWWWKEEMTERKRESWRKGEQSREKCKAFCNEPWLRNSTIPSVRFHFVSVPPCIFSSSRLAIITLSCRTSGKKGEKKKQTQKMFSAPILGGSFNFPFQTFGLEMRTAFWRFHSWTRSVVAPRSDALTLQGNAARSSTQRCLCASLIQMKISFASLYALCEVSLFFLSEWSLDSSPSKSWRSVFDKARIIVDDNLNMNRDVEDCSLSLMENRVSSV